MSARSLSAFLALLLGCTLFGAPPRDDAISAAVARLREAGFAFEPDVRFASHRYAVCQGLSCARIEVRAGHRTILIADGAFESPERLRATLLEIWERYREPRAPSSRDLARGALRVVRDGPQVGVSDPATLRQALREYRLRYAELSAAAREDLPDPAQLESIPR